MPLLEGTRWDYIHNEHPRCPHCDHWCNVIENEWWELFDDNGDRNVTCPSCEKEFIVEVHCKYTFSTDDQSELEESSAERTGASQ
jgi:hypothetical protein